MIPHKIIEIMTLADKVPQLYSLKHSTFNEDKERGNVFSLCPGINLHQSLPLFKNKFIAFREQSCVTIVSPNVLFDRTICILS